MTDDGFNIGILYRGNRRPYQAKVGSKIGDLAELEKEFAL
jgi:2-oxoglutarate ferredoxin oxidoreductase subunit beta